MTVNADNAQEGQDAEVTEPLGVHPLRPQPTFASQQLDRDALEWIGFGSCSVHLLLHLPTSLPFHHPSPQQPD